MLSQRVLGIALASFLTAGGIAAQDAGSKADAKSASQAAPQQTDPLTRPLSEKQKKENSKALQKEISRTYRKWLDEDVRWIITDEERATFKQLSNDEERDQFIEQFWLRRDPTPDTAENEYKEEHYRRIAYANEHFAAGIPGWKTDRGRMYIMYGPPNSIDSHPSGGSYFRPTEEGGGQTSTYPFEDWNYRYIEGVGQNIDIEFVDTCSCGEYHMTIDRGEKDALLHVPGAGLTMAEQMGMADKSSRFQNGGLESLGSGPFTQNEQAKQFDRLGQYAALSKPPAITVKFKDLEEVVSHKLSFNLLPFDVITDFVKVTSDTSLVPITVQLKNKDLTFVEKQGVQTAVVNIFGRLTTLTGRIAQTFEDTVTVQTPTELLPKEQEKPSVYWKALPLRSGRYRLDVVLKDVNSDRVGHWSRGIVVPEFSDDRLAVSSLILADDIEKVPTKNVGTGSFVIGDHKVRPRVPDAGKPASFKRNQRVSFWMQVYNLGIDQQTHKPSATVEYEITNLANHKAIVHATDSTQQMGNVGDQLTLARSLPLTAVEPGQYQVTIKVDDKVSKQTLSPTATFVVE